MTLNSHFEILGSSSEYGGILRKLCQLPVVFQIAFLVLLAPPFLYAVEFDYETGYWVPFEGVGADQTVYALAKDSAGNIVAGGNFTQIDGVSAKSIAQWNGKKWSPLGDGFEEAVYALTVGKDGTLYAAIRTPSTGIEYAVVKWNGTAWSYLGETFNGAVNSISVDDEGNLYAGGNFSRVGTQTAYYLANWDGTTWNYNHYAIDGEVLVVLAGSSGKLFIGGRFKMIDSEQIRYFAHYDGSTWSDLDASLDNAVYTITKDTHGNILIGGLFKQTFATEAAGIAKWDGQVWSQFGAGMQQVRAILPLGGDSVIAAGYFKTAGSVSALNIALWQNGEWHPIGAGLPLMVYCLTRDSSGKIIAGGGFKNSTSYPNTPNYIAQLSSIPSAIQHTTRSQQLTGQVSAEIFSPNGERVWKGMLSLSNGLYQMPPLGSGHWIVRTQTKDFSLVETKEIR